MADFTHFLPYDVLCLIFSNHQLTKSDHLECRKVCRSWRRHLPAYTKSFWRQVKFSGYDWKQRGSKVACFLGPHVNDVHIDTFPPKMAPESSFIPVYPSPRADDGEDNNDSDIALLQLLSMLVETKCNNIESLTFHHCKPMDNNAFLTRLKSLSKNLLKLSFIEHRTNLPFIATFATCPSLAQLIYSPYPGSNMLNDDVREVEPTVIDNSIPNDAVSPNMITLSIDAAISHKRLAAILERCPNLRMLRVNNDMDDWRQREVINIADIFQRCSLLEYVECNNTKSFSVRSEQKISQSIDDIIARYPHNDPASNNIVSPTTGLRELIFYDPTDSNTATAVLQQVHMHQNNLQLLEIGMKRDIPVSWDNLTAIHAPHLRVLRLVKIYCSEEAIASLISHCPCLEELLLHSRSATQAYAPPFSALRSSRNLRSLTVDYRYRSNDSADVENREGLGPIRSYLDETAPYSKIEQLSIQTSMRINLNNDRFLFSISSLPKLRSLTLINTSAEPEEGTITVRGVQEFIQRLQNTHAEELSLVCIEKISPKAIDLLAELPYLKKLGLYSCEHYNGQDLIRLVERTKSLREITIDDIELEQCDGLYGAVDYIEYEPNLNYGAVMVGPNQVSIEYLGP